MSSALDLDGSSKGTVLNGPCDWKQWISIIKKFATSHSLWDFLDPAVKEGSCGPNRLGTREEVVQRYRSTLQSPNRTKIEAWVTQWQKVLTEAKQLGLPDVQDLRPTQDFLQAVSSINAPFTDYWVNKMEDEAVFGKPDWKTDFPDGIKISEIFERAHRIKAANNSKGSFEPPSKNADGVPMCVCGEYHRFVDCFYLIKSARPDGWTPDQKVEKKIKEILDSNPWAKKMTEKAQDFKKKEMEKSPFWRIYVDIFSMNTSFNGKEAVLLIKDEFTSMIFIYLLNDATQGSVMTALRNHEAMVQRQWNLNICIIHRDNDRSLQSAYESWIEEKGFKMNLLPLHSLKTVLQSDLGTHTEIGYLVGYDSTNIFRIWIPSTSEVRRVRDVTFNESIFYDGNDQPPEPIPQRVEVQLPAHIEDESDYEEIPLKSMNLNLTPLSNLLNLRPRRRHHDCATALSPHSKASEENFTDDTFLPNLRPRLCVRGDLQQLGDKDTYAATLAGRSFRILMAITAKFDLETRQLDAVNAFTNALLEDEEEVYKELTAAFRELGLTQCPDEPCIFQNDWLTVFFFVDDIVFLYRKENEDAADEMVAALKRKYAMTDQGNYNGSLTPTLKGWFNGSTLNGVTTSEEPLSRATKSSRTQGRLLQTKFSYTRAKLDH
ncbi:integrase core domain-containing protein [Hirsutella rhossiliensis]|uniref:Integrase core domain-containing protein n=1 Tax=Hirsutella rhossiliensis TaxID=111463 RepID=A0A9P8NCQ0_9HYPO|nr:integrase core domain-containing protein [Hirsutella rhossiliensis]KAH0968727.1 integrase core domain-containing protein [Hirsutella rhossiliensis]